jgi:hypothetical protein
MAVGRIGIKKVQLSANLFNEKIPSKPATGLGILSLLDMKRSLNLR